MIFWNSAFQWEDIHGFILVMLPTELQEESNQGGGDVDADVQLLNMTDLREATSFLIEGVLIPLLTVFGIIGKCK